MGPIIRQFSKSHRLLPSIFMATRLDCSRGTGISRMYNSRAIQLTCSTAWIGMTETIKIAFVSTILGMILSLPIALLAARNLNSPRISYLARFILAAGRSLPSLIWAIFFVILIGLGPLSGIFCHDNLHGWLPRKIAV